MTVKTVMNLKIFVCLKFALYLFFGKGFFLFLWRFLALNRRKQRELIFLLLFEHIFTGYSFEELKEIKLSTEELSQNDFGGFSEEYFKEILEKTSELDELIAKHSIKWCKERLSKVALTILRLAVYEIIFRDEIPVSVAINEAVELSKKYGADKESSFVNGILGGISRDLESKND